MQPPPDPHTVDIVVAIIAIGALVIGLISMLVGRAVEGFDRARDWWHAPGSAGSQAPERGSRTGPADPVSGRQNQQSQELELTFEDVLAFLAAHKLSDEEATDLLAVAARADDYLLSANKIRDVVGGADAVVKARVASHRPKKATPRLAARLVRPEGGWG